MPEAPPVICNAGMLRKESRNRSLPWNVVFTLLAILSASFVAGGQQLPPG